KKQDKTRQIQSFEFKDSKLLVQFYQNPKIYSYTKENFYFHSQARDISMQVDFEKSKLFGAQKIVCFDIYSKVFFKNESLLVLTKELVFCDTKINMDYFRAIAKIVSLKNANEESLLQRALQKITHLNALEFYLYPKAIRKRSLKKPLIFPFGSNESQYKAVQNAMTHQISIIKGPPGTGKTQSILNVIANVLLHKQSIAVVSNNNAALKNILDKLESYGFDCLCAFLGNRENKEKFIQNQKLISPTFRLKNSLEEKALQMLSQSVNTIFDLENQKAQNQSLLSSFKLEFKYFKSAFQSIKLKTRKAVHYSKILKEKMRLEHKQKLSFWDKCRLIFWVGVGDFAFYKQEKLEILKHLDYLYYRFKILELYRANKQIQKRLELLKSEDMLLKFKEESLIYLENFLYSHLKANVSKRHFSLEDMQKDPKAFLKQYPIVLSTTHSIKNTLNCEFDWLIIDEASCVDILTGILSLSCAKNALIVGDEKQLGNVVTNEHRLKILELNEQYKPALNYDYLRHNFLSSALQTFKECPVVLLKEHYRCHPKIISFCNQKFYHNELIIRSKDKNEKDVLELITTSGNHARARFNLREIEIIQREILPTLKKQTTDIGIITPYNEQKNALQNLEPQLEIDTIHKFQGREKEAIIFSAVDNKINDFLNDAQILNVAVSRAKRYFKLVISQDLLQSQNHLSDLAKFIQYHNFQISKSQIQSIFDLLYKENAKARMAYLKKHLKAKDFNLVYESEKLIAALLNEIFAKAEFAHLDFVTHIPLARILNHTQKLNETERKFALNPLSHIDFVIYNRFDKSLVTCIEVDGYTYHKKEKQSKRDVIKDSILEKYNIALLRLNTTQSEEKQRIESLLRSK
ncbi:AAA domain-containing protein, partial [Helicobacter himalayensis]|uniref:AAA domain-containing protein n=1 Tax=Helicobacter himalayensis TaxID=1591088 RepID=UPI003D6E964C